MKKYRFSCKIKNVLYPKGYLLTSWKKFECELSFHLFNVESFFSPCLIYLICCPACEWCILIWLTLSHHRVNSVEIKIARQIILCWVRYYEPGAHHSICKGDVSWLFGDTVTRVKGSFMEFRLSISGYRFRPTLGGGGGGMYPILTLENMEALVLDPMLLHIRKERLQRKPLQNECHCSSF